MINVVLFVVFIFTSFMIMKSDINKLGCILFVHLYSFSLENFKDRALIQLLKAYRIKFQKSAAHAHKDALINETFIQT